MLFSTIAFGLGFSKILAAYFTFAVHYGLLV